ncbi:MAG: methionine synthase [Chloroflexi bacterium]|nr:methionine synthase [Chloroflexota bacterium]
MYVQFAEGLPGVNIDTEKQRIFVDRSQGLDKDLEDLYTAYTDNDPSAYGIGPNYAAGLHAMLESRIESPLAVKGQVTGPVSLGLFLTDGVRYVIYDEQLAEAIARHLRLKAAWQERAMSRLSRNTVIFVDEPSLASLGSPFVSLSSETALALLKETLGGIAGLKGLHCCGAADWSLLFRLPIDILSLDVYSYPDTLSLYPAEVKAFLREGRTIAWGIVPNEEQAIAKETAASLYDRLEEAMAPFTRNNGIPFRQLVEQGLLTPSCGLASVSVEAAETALELLARLSARIRQKHTA